MNFIKLFKKLRSKLVGGETLVQYLRECGIEIGSGCRIFCDISTTESYLISIGNNTTISGNVTLVTYDASISKAIEGRTDLFGKIRIGDNCFIGEGATILYGVTLPDNTIVGASSVVTKSINESGKIIAGNPAKIVGDFESFSETYKRFAVNIKGMSPEEKKDLLSNEKIMVKR